jgi:hypothetical protein
MLIYIQSACNTKQPIKPTMPLLNAIMYVETNNTTRIPPAINRPVQKAKKITPRAPPQTRLQAPEKE